MSLRRWCEPGLRKLKRNQNALKTQSKRSLSLKHLNRIVLHPTDTCEDVCCSVINQRFVQHALFCHVNNRSL